MLSDSPAIGSLALGPGNVTWAYQWDTTIQPGSTFIISKDKRLSGITPIPEPGTAVLLATAGLGLLACAWRRWRR